MTYDLEDILEVKIMKASKKYKLNSDDSKKILKGALISCGAALMTYGLELLPQIDFGGNTLLIVAIMGPLINAGKKYFEGKK